MTAIASSSYPVPVCDQRSRLRRSHNRPRPIGTPSLASSVERPSRRSPIRRPHPPPAAAESLAGPQPEDHDRGHDGGSRR